MTLLPSLSLHRETDAPEPHGTAGRAVSARDSLPVGNGLQISSLTPQDYAALGDAHAALAAAAGTHNPHAAPAAVCAAVALLPPGTPVQVLAAHLDGRLVGIWPLAIVRHWSGQRVLRAPLVPLYDVSGMPLLAAGLERTVLDALLAHLAADKALPAVLLAEGILAAGPFATTDGTVLEHWQRAVMLPGAPVADAEAYLTARLSGPHRKRLRQKRRKLESMGALALVVDSTPAALEHGLAAFAALEAEGWKGRAGTALALRPADLAYMRALVMGLAARSDAFCARLTLDGATIAGGLLLRSGDTLFFAKTCFDERLAKLSPGVVLDVLLTDWLLTQPGIRCLDTSINGSADMQVLWRERQAMMDLLVATRGRDPAAWLLATAHASRAALRRKAHRLLARWPALRARLSRGPGRAPS
jgi:CelD/BcsL family acetyltransferase involved in cellulose biosynthesis